MLPLSKTRLEQLKQNTASLKDALMLGSVSEVKSIVVLGRATSNGMDYNVWDYPGIYPYLAADTDLYLTSDNALDSDIPVLVKGLDENFNPIQSLTTLTTTDVGPPATDATTPALVIDNDYSGAPPVPAKQFYRITSISIPSGPLPLGNVYLATLDTYVGVAGIPDNPTTTLVGYLPAGQTETRMGMYTVPAGRRAIVHGFTVSGTGIGAADKLALRYRRDPLANFVKHLVLPANGLNATSDPNFHGLHLSAGADLDVVWDANAADPVFAAVYVAEMPADLV